MKLLHRPLLLCTVCCFVVFGNHILDLSNSMVNFSDGVTNPERHIVAEAYLQTVVDMHGRHPAFVKRPVTTWLINGLADHTPLSTGWSFILIGFGFLFASGLALYYLALEYLHDKKHAAWSMLAYFGSFTTFFIFFPPLYSYDEPLQFFLLFASLLALLRQKWIAFVLAFTLSLTVRESGLLLLPSIVLFLALDLRKRPWLSKQNLIRVGICCLPVLLYAGFLWPLISSLDIQEASKGDVLERFKHWDFNFQSSRHGIESILSLIMALGLPVFAVLINRKNTTLTDQERQHVRAFWLCLIINTTVVLTTTLARESRLFAMPLFFAWPFLGKWMASTFGILFSKASWATLLRSWKHVVGLMLVIALAIFVMDTLYKPTDAGRSGSFQDEYLALSLVATGAVLLLKHKNKNAPI